MQAKTSLVHRHTPPRACPRGAVSDPKPAACTTAPSRACPRGAMSDSQNQPHMPDAHRGACPRGAMSAGQNLPRAPARHGGLPPQSDDCRPKLPRARPRSGLSRGAMMQAKPASCTGHATRGLPPLAMMKAEPARAPAAPPRACPRRAVSESQTLEKRFPYRAQIIFAKRPNIKTRFEDKSLTMNKSQIIQISHSNINRRFLNITSQHQVNMIG